MDKSTLGKILIIDDDPDIQDIYAEVLKEAGYEVTQARDGQEGLEKAQSGGYDLILLDIMMPKIDGMTLLKKLREHPSEVYNGPIFVLSQLNQGDIISQAMSLGAKGYFVKSDLTPDMILSKISQILSR